LECRVPRLWGHYNRDIEHYRSKEDRQTAADSDPLALLSNRLLDARVVDQAILENISREVTSRVQEVVDSVLQSKPPDAASAASHVWAMPSAWTADPAAETVEPRNMSYLQAINEALSRELQSRPEVLVYGEDVGHAGGIFGASRNLQKTFGAERVFDMPIAESAILGSAVGAALSGLKPIVEIMWADFMLVALDQLINQAANIRYITAGRCNVPLVVRTQQGATPGSCAQHSQSLEALLAHIPGLRIAVPATPQDAYTLLRCAVADPDPCIVFEARSLYQTSGPVVLSDQLEPIGKAALRKRGSDAVIVAWGTMVRAALEAAATLETENIHAGVLDLRWLSPLDESSLRQAVLDAKGRVVVAHEANITGGFGGEIIARLHEHVAHSCPLKAVRVGAPNVRIPAAPALSQQLLPNAAKIAAAVRSLL
jgi:2-oxoisovalerate dehydrogenase E1 component